MKRLYVWFVIKEQTSKNGEVGVVWDFGNPFKLENLCINHTNSGILLKLVSSVTAR